MRKNMLFSLIIILFIHCAPADRQQNIISLFKEIELITIQYFEKLPDTITIRFGGDVMMTRRMLPHLEVGINPFSNIAPIFSDCELAMINLETTIGTNGEPEKGKTYTFMTDPNTLVFVTNAGVDIACLGNNHTFDYGEKGLLSTIHFLEQYGIFHTGAGTNSNHASIPVIFETNGFKIAVLSFGDVYPVRMYSTLTQPGIAKLEITEVTSAILDIRHQVDYMIVNMHTGVEYVEFPTSRQKREAHRYIEEGADLIIMHGPHVLQGMEFYEGGMIYYSLGNLIFDQGFGETPYTMIGEAKLQVEKLSNGQWDISPQFAVIPVTRDTNHYQDRVPTQQELAFITNRLIYASAGLGSSNVILNYDKEIESGFQRYLIGFIPNSNDTIPQVPTPSEYAEDYVTNTNDVITNLLYTNLIIITNINEISNDIRITNISTQNIIPADSYSNTTISTQITSTNLLSNDIHLSENHSVTQTNVYTNTDDKNTLNSLTNHLTNK